MLACMLLRRQIASAVVCVVVGYLFASFIGVSHIGMGQEMNGQTVRCPFMPGIAICNMTPMQHIAAAQSVFNSLVQLDFSTFVLLLLAFLIAATISRRWPAQRPRVIPLPVFVKAQTYASPRFALQEAYARGILNPKLF